MIPGKSRKCFWNCCIPLRNDYEIELDATNLKTFLIAEQLEKIEGGMDSINADMQIAEKALKGMELCCGIFPKFWKK